MVVRRDELPGRLRNCWALPMLRAVAIGLSLLAAAPFARRAGL
jgi:hypothetical protein